MAASALWNVPPAHAAKFVLAPVAVYYAQIPLIAGRTVTAVTLPDNRDLHLFDIGVPVAATFDSLPPALDDTALVPARDALEGNYDGAGRSYNSAALATAGLRPGAPVTSQGVTFRWPQYGGGRFDNVRAEGQTIAVSGTGGVLGFLGSATAGTQAGQVKIQYVNGSSESATLTFASWRADRAADGGRVVATVPWNQAAGSGRQQVSVYSAVIPLRAGQAVASVTLPDNFDIHVFAIAVGR
jgi:beta-glucosidase